MLKFKSFSNLVDKEIEELSENEALKKKAAKSGISYGTLKKVFNRGMAAWKSGHRPGTTPQQWGHARVNSYITKGKGTYYGADSDLSGKGKKKDKKEGYVSYAQQKAAHASMAEKGKKKKNNESVNEAEYHPIKSFYHDDMAKAHASHAKRHKTEGDSGKHNNDNEDMHYRAIDIHKQAHAAHMRARDAAGMGDEKKYKKAAKDAHEYSKTAIGTTKDAGKFKTGTPKHKFPKLTLHTKLKKLGEARVTSIDFRKKNAMVNPMDRKNISDMAKDKKYKGNTSALIRDVKKKYPDQHHSKIVKDIYRRHAETNEAKVQEISKGLAMRYIGKASRDVYHKGQQQGTADAISRLGGPTKDYKKSPERKAAKRVAGIDRATKITSMGPLSYPIGKRFKKNEAMSDAEKAAHQKAIDAFKAKGGKIKKLKPGYAQGYHGKPDPAAGMKGMMDKGDTKAFGTRKKVGSMK